MNTRKLEEMKVLLVNPWADQYVPEIKRRFPNINLISVRNEDELEGVNVSDVDVVVTWETLTRTIPRINNLKWFHCLAAGYNHILDAGVLTKEMIFTTVAGAAAIPVSEFVMGFLFNIVKRFPEMYENQRQHKFVLHFPGRELYGKTIGILGMGNIGRAVAKKAKAMDMVVLGYDNYVSEAEGVEKIYSGKNLRTVLQMSDFVVISLPLSEETAGLIGEDQFRAMKPGAYLINVARGEIVVREALIKALEEKIIAGAALDVFWGFANTAGLTPDDELWDIPNVIISPHCATVTDMFVPRTAEIFCRNLENYLKGRPMINVIGH
ncbi:MAG: D-2-hydroxyacid dehydrogenase [Thermincola sp.]|jgi:phosphoglycerate dehydrogenase-like enzyme|nr:D-2-hydroxyacid dehydrogenase [Thermincola sp.]MDT3704924.1 D-2-hydroxyacid dehydrogenase [Thermincola sp.]